ncbi:MAG: hypothetical protein QNJ55_35305 [Xenococcus sp. MO_188.B8]|nr:hypothetical protein [Xenococcus sp. MO_188.B8]
MDFVVESGVTSVFLDLPLLEEAAGLTLVTVDSEAEPFSEDFQVGFAITEDTDFSFTSDPFTPLGGTIEHSGTITLALGETQVTVGDFSIGFDASRVSETASGFFVADTLEDPLGLEILFDISAPGVAAVSEEQLEISDADLLLAPELTTALALPDLTGADVGDTRVDATVAAINTIDSGITSVFLDLPLLEEAAGLTLVSVDSEAEPFSEDFQLGFAITEDTDFSFTSDPFTPLGGTIEHSGTITLALGETEVTVGEFSIGFDASRVSETASGFFVADTLEDPLGLEILFDISAPGVVEVSEEQLEISDADLLLAPELVTALALPDLTGADVGDTRIDATITPADSGSSPLDTPFVRFQNSSVPGTYVYATGAEAENIRANLPDFVEEGVAFNAAIEPDDDLIALSRLESNQLPGTFLYVGEEELNSINADPNFSNAFTNQGVAFYVYGVGANQETPFSRFQNSDVPGTYLYATGEEADNIRANFTNFNDEGTAFEAVI